MACNCGKSSGEPAETYVVRKTNGTTEGVTSKVTDDILVTKHDVTYTVKKK